MRLLAKTSTRSARSERTSASDAWVSSATRFTPTAAATPIPILLVPGVLVLLPADGVSTPLLIAAPATVKAKTCPATLARAVTPPAQRVASGSAGAMSKVLGTGAGACESMPPMTARVWRSRLLTAIAIPTPTASPVATPPAQLIWVSRLPAYTSTRPPPMVDPASRWARVSLFCSTYANVPPMASVPASAPACEKLKPMMASSALMFSPERLPL